MAHLPPEDLRFVLSKRGLSGDVALDCVLADIPFLTVGILGFCTFTFFALTRRLGIMLITLHLSIIAAFVASTLDLAQILQRGSLNTELGLQLDSVQSLIKAREIGYALSNSLRFLFFWIFVAEPPRSERSTSNARAGVHSGSWNAWGFIGVILQYSALGLTLTVFALQVVWRIDSKFSGFTALYAAESAIQVVLSAIFALKLLLNCIHCTIVPKWASLLDHLGFTVSLLFGIGFGVANVIDLDFTESILGRFLQGVNFYILVLSSLLWAFMPLPRSQSGRIPSFRPLSPKEPASSFNVAPPDVSTPNLSAIHPLPNLPIIQPPQVERSPSTAKLSVWLATQRKRLSSLSYRGDSPDDMDIKLWSQNRAEHGQSFWEDPSIKDSDSSAKPDGYPDSYLSADQPPPTERPKQEAPQFERESTLSVASRYSGSDLSLPETIDRKSPQVDSPVFGLNGIIQPPYAQSRTDSPQGSLTVPEPDRSSGSGISNLFRKQEELDKSIAALKLFDGTADLPISPSSSKPSREPSTARSDFSLSNFPNPPWVDAPDTDTLSEPRPSLSSVHTVRPSRFGPPSVNVDNVPFDLVPPQMPISMMEHNRTLSLPTSESAESDLHVSARPPRFDSQGTQYDVTSFIGNLTDPRSGHKKEFSGSSNNTVTSSWSDDPEPTATIVTLQQSKQTYVGSPLARMPVIVSTTPGILPATRVMLPSKPKLDISQPRPAVPRLRQEVSSDTFERPRAVPSMYR